MFDVYHTETELCLMSMLVLLTCVETFTEHQEEGVWMHRGISG